MTRKALAIYYQKKQKRFRIFRVEIGAILKQSKVFETKKNKSLLGNVVENYVSHHFFIIKSLSEFLSDRLRLL